MKTIALALITALAIAGSVAAAPSDPPPPPGDDGATQRTTCHRTSQGGITRYVECEVCCVEVQGADGRWYTVLCSAPNCNGGGLPPVVN